MSGRHVASYWSHTRRDRRCDQIGLNTAVHIHSGHFGTTAARRRTVQSFRPAQTSIPIVSTRVVGGPRAVGIADGLGMLCSIKERHLRRTVGGRSADGIGGVVPSVYLREGTTDNAGRVSGTRGRPKHGLNGIAAPGNRGARTGNPWTLLTTVSSGTHNGRAKGQAAYLERAPEKKACFRSIDLHMR